MYFNEKVIFFRAKTYLDYWGEIQSIIAFNTIAGLTFLLKIWTFSTIFIIFLGESKNAFTSSSKLLKLITTKNKEKFSNATIEINE